MKFKQCLAEFLSSKTNWTALTMIGAAGVGYITHALDAIAAFNMGMGGLGMLFIRDAIAGLKPTT